MAPISGMAQQAGAVFRIGVLSPAEHPSTRVFDAFRDALLKLGYIEGRNLTIEYAFAAGDNNLPALAEDLVRLAVDLIVTDGGDEVARIAHRAARTCRS